MRSISSFFPTANEATSPAAALLSSEMIPSVRVLVLFAVADAPPFDRLRRATSNLRLGEESTA